jgi:Flp pilus assembly protein TadG
MPTRNDLRRRPPRQRHTRQALADRTGAVGLEFALLLPAMVLLLMGMFDYGSLSYQTMEVTAAAHAGADYALHNGWNATAVQTAVTSATGLSVTASPAPALSKACVTNNALVVTTGTTCPSGGAPGNYAIVNAQAPFTPLVSWSAFVMPSTISAQAAVRLQ